MVVDPIDKAIVLTKWDKIVDPNMVVDLIPCQDLTHPTLATIDSSKPLDIEANHIEEIMHTKANHVDIYVY